MSQSNNVNNLMMNFSIILVNESCIVTNCKLTLWKPG